MNFLTHQEVDTYKTCNNVVSFVPSIPKNTLFDNEVASLQIKITLVFRDSYV